MAAQPRGLAPEGAVMARAWRDEAHAIFELSHGGVVVASESDEDGSRPRVGFREPARLSRQLKRGLAVSGLAVRLARERKGDSARSSAEFFGQPAQGIAAARGGAHSGGIDQCGSESTRAGRWGVIR